MARQMSKHRLFLPHVVGVVRVPWIARVSIGPDTLEERKVGIAVVGDGLTYMVSVARTRHGHENTFVILEDIRHPVARGEANTTADCGSDGVDVLMQPVTRQPKHDDLRVTQSSKQSH